MSTTETPALTATLVRGRYYDLHGTVWNRDVLASLTQTITPEMEEHMREHAVDIEHHHGHEFRYPRFKFSTDADNDVGPSVTSTSAGGPNIRRRRVSAGA